MTKPKSQTARRAAPKIAKPAPSRTRKAAVRKLDASKPAATQQPTSAPEPVAPTTKLAILTALLRREEGATVAQMMAATGWQAHSVRGALAGTLARTFAAKVTSQLQDGVRVYRAPKPAA